MEIDKEVEKIKNENEINVFHKFDKEVPAGPNNLANTSHDNFLPSIEASKKQNKLIIGDPSNREIDSRFYLGDEMEDIEKEA